MRPTLDDPMPGEMNGRPSQAARDFSCRKHDGYLATDCPPCKAEQAEAKLILRPLSVRDLIETYKVMREPVIDGLLRVGEIMNLIAPPKYGKSWLVLWLVLSVATGRDWLGFPTSAGKILLVDNELHAETLASRMRRVCDAFEGISLDDIADRVDVLTLRGGLQDLHKLGAFFRSVPHGHYRLVVLDAFYRTLPANTDENSNGNITSLYNVLDSYADSLGCGFVLVHHASKGKQNEKGVTDVGSGAGSQSRAADTHLILRPHEEEDVVVLDGVVRSFPPVAPKCLRWAWPCFTVADDLNPQSLAQSNQRTKSQADHGKFLNELDQMDPQRQGVSRSKLKAVLGFNSDKMTRIEEGLIREGVICVIPGFEVDTPNGGKKAAAGLRRNLIPER